jgi:Ca2+-binding RTX toxin-like protein
MLFGNRLNNTLTAGAGNNVLYGNSGIDTVSYAHAASAVTVNIAEIAAQATGGSGSDTLIAIENLTGSSYNDTLGGNNSANILDGGAGNDTLAGGLGNDTYVINTLADLVTEKVGEGTDLIQSAISYSLLDTDGAGAYGGNVENLQLSGTANANGTGNALANLIYANGGVNSLDGGDGIDTVSYRYATTTGSSGVTLDLSLVNASGQATASGISGADRIKNIENITGSNYADTLTGNAAANVLNGGTGADSLTGGDGSDTYYVDHAGDVVSETNASASTGGTETVYSTLASYTLGSHIENGRILATTAANLTGNSLNNLLYAGVGNNVLNGSTGIDTVSYAYGVTGTTDVSLSRTTGVSVSLAVTTAQATGGSGSDTLKGIENLTGSNKNDTLTGNSAANILNGGAGIDTMTGGDGSDTYHVDHTGDVVYENNASASTGGSDHVHSTLAAYTLRDNVENGRILATGAANLTGNTLNNVLYAGAGNNVLDGGSGIDTVSYAYGLAGTSGVTVSLAVGTAQATGGSGSDTLTSIENLIGSAYADRLTGNTGANSLGGGAGNDTFDGGAGSDTLAGGDGSDTYVVRNGGDVVSETNAVLATGGSDTVYCTLAAYTLTANVENGRILATVAANLTGNTLNNVLYAGAGNNVLDGGTGIDTVSYAYGLAGTTGVTVSLAVGTAQATGGSGSDTLTSIENLIGSAYADRLTGNTGANSLGGGAGNDTLDGGAGSDTLAGGDGSDTYVVRDGGDVVSETNAVLAYRRHRYRLQLPSPPTP